jgi:hypothetical protein
MPYPIGFPIPAEKIVYAVPEKSKYMAHIIPGRLETYVFRNEEDYYKDYQQSIFGTTKCKSGWDCMRHLEILANGCIPWFIDLDQCPEQTMTFFPKALVKEAMRVLKDCNQNDPRIIDYTERLLEHTHEHLTTEAMANYILSKINKNVKSVLFLSGDVGPDYLRCMLLHGFKKLLGPECHDYKCVPHLYTDYPTQINSWNGKPLFTITNLLQKENYRNPAGDSTVESDIKNHKYDIIIYGSVHRGKPFWSLVNANYKPNEIVLCCGEDLHTCEYKNEKYNEYPVFIREL